jgi:uncharacterized protein YceH (UPF0502 family)
VTELTAEEQRVLGALIEKQYLTPDVYPMTMNGLVSACNQTSNRHPVAAYDEATIHAALDGLREKGLTRVVYSPSNRATKYRQVFEESRQLTRAEAAVMCVLLLRGPQTVGELRTRTERIHGFESLAEVEAVLERLSGPTNARPDEPLVRRLDRGPGQKEARYTHLMGPVAEPAPDDGPRRAAPPADGVQPGMADEVRQLRADLDVLRAAHDALRAAHDALRAEFEALRDQLV